jgi:hypothetical protein
LPSSLSWPWCPPSI